MEHKLNIGDQFYHPGFIDTIFQVVDIVEGTKDYYGPWVRAPYLTVNDCYIVKEIKNGKLSKEIMYTRFEPEDEIILISKFCPIAQPKISKCPRCNGELINVESESILGTKYQGQKCNVCGYCA